jgi:predicted dehydrogenase
MDVGVVGVGAMGKNHARVYSELKQVGTLYIYDLNTRLAESVAEKTDAECLSSMDEMLRKAEALSLCVPTPYHFDTAKTILEAGVNVLIEKPICLTASDAEELVQHIPEDVTVGVGHIERFNPIISEIKRIIKEPLYFEMKRHNPASARVNGSSVVEDLMIHDIDNLFNSFFEEAVQMETFGNKDICTAVFNFGKTPAFLSASRKSSKKIRSIHIEEEDFTIYGDMMNQELYVYWKPENYQIEEQRYSQENIIEKVMIGKIEPLKTELYSFLNCIKTGKAFPVTPVQAMNNMKICEKIVSGLN